MSTLSPALADAGHLLHDDLYIHLDEADYLAEQDDEWSAADIQTRAGSSATWYWSSAGC